MIHLLISLTATAVTAWTLGYLLGRHDGHRKGRWDGLEEGYADAMRDGWGGGGS